MQRSIEDIKHTRQLQPRMNLDRLPAETLENILLYSGSISLPRASPIIGAKLSSRVTLLRFFIWAFHDTWDQWFGIPVGISLHGPLTEEHMQHSSNDVRPTRYWPCAGDPELQSTLLEQPWVDIDFILQAQQMWANKYARSRWFEHICPINREETLDVWGRTSIGTAGFGAFRAREVFELEYDLALTDTTDFGGAAYCPIAPCTRDVHPDVRIPQSLMTGPWNEEQRRRLYWLVRGGVDLENARGPTRSLPWEYYCEFLHNSAINAERPDMLVHRCLFHKWMVARIPVETIRRGRDDLVVRLEWGSDHDSVPEMAVLRKTLDALNYQLDYSMFHK